MASLPPARKKRRLRDLNTQNPLLSLPRDILQSILARVDLLSHVRLGAVCRSLRRLAIIENPPSSKPLWRVGSTEPEKLLRSFFTIPAHYGLRRPRPQSSLSLNILGCHEGWMVMEEPHNPQRTIYAYNRILNSQITFPGTKRPRNVCKVILSSDPRSRNCIVAAMHDFNCVSIVRPHRDRSWMMLSYADARRSALDLAFYQNPQANNGYSTCSRNNLWLWVMFAEGFYGINLNSFPISLQRLNVDFPTRSPDFSSLIVFESKLLLGTICMDPEERSFDLSFEGCLWELNTETMEFVKAVELQRGALLLGTSHSAYMPSSECQSLKGGKIHIGANVSWLLTKEMEENYSTNALGEEEDENSKSLHGILFP